ncbi:hypothetical protein [Nocardioides zeae]
MAAVQFEHIQAHDRLARMSLNYEMLSRALARADAEVALVSGLEPINARGIAAYSKGVGFLREELIPLGWEYDPKALLCRTYHPSRGFSIVVTSGDKYTGLAGGTPSTRNPKGMQTIAAVAKNAGQFAFELGQDFEPDTDKGLPEDAPTWFLMYRATPEFIFAELSLPVSIAAGHITEWKERIILEPIKRHETPLEDPRREDPPAEEYPVEVTPAEWVSSLRPG